MNSFLTELLTLPKSGMLPALPDGALKSELQDLVEAVKENDENGCKEFHQLLFDLNRLRFSADTLNCAKKEQWIRNICSYLELEWYGIERQNVMPELLEAPVGTDDFTPWLEGLEHTGYGQNHPLFNYLAKQADWHDFQYFFRQEFSSEAGFDDLVALTQIKAPSRVKMELANNYWDEMGRGNPKGVHGYLLHKVGEYFDVIQELPDKTCLWGPLALSNIMITFAANRSLFYQAVGALGVIELTAPSRCVKVIQGLKRIGVPSEDYHYYTLHASLDRKHWDGWKRNVITPLISQSTASQYAIAEGALLRLHAGKRCFEQYAGTLLSENKPMAPVESIT